MDKCITCLPNGNIKQHEYVKFLKDNNINKIVYRLGEDKDWNFTTLESWNVLSKKLKKNKKLEWFTSLEYKEQ